MRLDADKHKPGIQELKEWKAVMAYIKSFPDTDGNGLPNVPDTYQGKLGRNVVEASWNPYKLLKRGTYVTWLAFSALLVGILLILSFSSGVMMASIRSAIFVAISICRLKISSASLMYCSVHRCLSDVASISCILRSIWFPIF